ncbi:MAG: hypothetical protein CMF96_00710 [Candidatus Marinimicrobia bacterium]|nr:hypothetical protein [Candidatus Neomarinimicrobiota bacterium]|tara:strand:+ start:6762 stop:7649 length:888 start_codon:yes stop_codon:yes gene_type:complete
MNTTSQNEFYLNLKQKRESQGIEISEISEQTKINPKYFLEFEKGNFSILPVVYARLFLRSYAIEIGANPDKVLEDYEVYTTGKVQPKSIVNNLNKIEESNIKTETEDSFFSDEGLFQNINQKNLIGGIIALIVIVLLVGKLRDITADTTSNLELKSVKAKKTILKDGNQTIIPGAYLDGFKKVNDKSIKLNIFPPFTLTFTSKYHSTVKLKTIENGVTTLEKKLSLKPALPLTRESNGKIEFELQSTSGIEISLNDDKEIISQFLKPENISDEDLGIKVILEEDGNLKAEYFKFN